MPYLSWEVGPDVSDSQFYDMRKGVLFMHEYGTSMGLPKLEDRVVYYTYWDLAPAFARSQGFSEQRARELLEDYGTGFTLPIHPGSPDSASIYLGVSEWERDGVPPELVISNSAHELSHIYQRLLVGMGGSRPDLRGPFWIIEGGAEFQAARSLAKGELMIYDQRREQYAEDALTVEAPLPELETREQFYATEYSYPLGTLAVELLASHAGEEAVITYWTLFRPETTWREAFETAFGLTIDEFYPMFEEHRAAGFPKVKLPHLGLTVEELSQSDRSALVAFYNATGGAYWANNRNWLSDEHIGRWQGVTINASGRVTELYLPENGLSGNLPPEVGSLTELRELILWANELTGPIPPELASLKGLEHLGLGGNRLGGKIPAWLGSFSNLRVLHLVNNRFTGRIPPEVGDLSLRGLYLLDNRLTGDIPAELGNLTDLQSIWLRDNNLTGCIPAGLQDVPDNDFAEAGLSFCGQ